MWGKQHGPLSLRQHCVGQTAWSIVYKAALSGANSMVHCLQGSFVWGKQHEPLSIRQLCVGQTAWSIVSKAALCGANSMVHYL